MVRKEAIIIAVVIAVLAAVSVPLSRQTSDAAKTGYKTKLEEKKIGAMKDDTYIKKPGLDVIYLAGGCFWGMEKLYSGIDGVKDVTSGYANGKKDVVPTYDKVCTGRTGYRETVRVIYDPEKVTLGKLIYAYFYVIDPTIKARQGNDIGDQYQSGIYYADKKSEKTVLDYAATEEKRNVRFYVEIEPLRSFYEAEKYHQDYLEKNPGGYCHITPAQIKAVQNMKYDPGKYKSPGAEKLKKILTGRQYEVTQHAMTEPAFDNEYYNSEKPGIYVDRVTGSPLFFSKDKFESSCGWPAFSKAIDDTAIVRISDGTRTEVRSRNGNAHLGHVFTHDGESPNGTRYCINSASIKFVPYDKMKKEGYGYLTRYVK